MVSIVDSFAGLLDSISSRSIADRLFNLAICFYLKYSVAWSASSTSVCSLIFLWTTFFFGATFLPLDLTAVFFFWTTGFSVSKTSLIVSSFKLYSSSFSFFSFFFFCAKAFAFFCAAAFFLEADAFEFAFFLASAFLAKLISYYSGSSSSNSD